VEPAPTDTTSGEPSHPQTTNIPDPAHDVDTMINQRLVKDPG